MPSVDATTDPPRGVVATLAQLGPGMVLAGSIVGSGELIATTTTGARAGFTLLWLILAGCLIKVFAQVELGRAAVVRGRTALGALDELPGPRARAGWAVWAWVLMTILTVAQQGGIVGGVGKTLALAAPLTDGGARYESLAEAATQLEIDVARGVAGARVADLEAARVALATQPASSDALAWAAIMTAITCLLLGVGRYGLIQLVATVAVGAFTLLTVVTVVLLQGDPEWAVRGAELREGMAFTLPTPREGIRPVATALATFGMIGVGAAELVAYPYWCLEKGYGRWTGHDDGSDGWAARARGWLRVMRLDAWLSAVVYTFATVAFYLLGAAVLGRVGLDPGGDELVRTLAAMYEPVFGTWARPVFLAGAFCVLYSTFFVGAAGAARVAADALVLLGFVDDSPTSRVRWVRILSIAFPLTSLAVFAFVQAPVALVLAGGVAQALMLPVLAAVALHQRYRRTARAMAPGRLWDTGLVVSSAGLVVAGAWTLWSVVSR